MSTTTTNIFTSRYQLFLGLSAFLVVINLVLLNDWMEIKGDWEGFFLEHILEKWPWSKLNLPQFLVSLFFEKTGGNLFLARLPGTLVLLGGGLGAYRLARPIFGSTLLTNSSLVLCTSFLLLFAAKLLVGDVWLMMAQVFAIIFLLRFLKEPGWPWMIGFWLAALLGIWTHAWSMIISVTAYGLYLRFVHPEGKKLDRLFFGLLPLVLFFINYRTYGFIFDYERGGYLSFLGLTFLGFLPWTALLLAAFPDLVYKLKRREEMAIILGGIVLAGLLGQSLLLVVALALLIGRQVSAYFDPNYPYRTLARAGGVLHLLFSFLVITYLLLTAYTTIGATGFRAVMAPGAIYWMCTFVGVIGLYSNQRRLLLAGMAWGALLAVLLFWIQTYPVFYT